MIKIVIVPVMTREQQEYYRKFNNGDKEYEIHEVWLKYINPYVHTAYEFGCGTGHNMVHLEEMGIKTFGSDLSEVAVPLAYRKGLDVVCENESILDHLKNFDLVYTLSVLNHIEDIEWIMKEISRIADIQRIFIESPVIPDNAHEFWYVHDYESYGLKKIDYEWESPLLPNSKYGIYIG